MKDKLELIFITMVSIFLMFFMMAIMILLSKM